MRAARRRAAAAIEFELASALLRYPDDNLVGALEEVRAAVSELPTPLRDDLLGLVQWLQLTPIASIQQEYCETFDFDRRASLYLTWHQYGDRRQRGLVLLKLRRAYLDAGFEPVEDELPDWLPMLLEFAAATPDGIGRDLLQQWRASIELIRVTLHERERRWAPVLDLVSAPLPRLGGDLRSQVKRLLEEGPPGEEVGLEPFGDLSSNLMPMSPLGAACDSAPVPEEART